MNMIPAGTYVARAVGHDFGVTANDKDYVAVDFELLGPTHQGERIGWRGYFSTENAIRRTLESLQYAGWSGQQDTLETLPGLGTTQVEIVIDHEEYDGRVYPRVQWVNKPGGGVAVGQQMDATRRRTFAARMRGHVAALAAPAAAPAAPRRPAGPPPPPATSYGPSGEDDIPF